jgi:hypothetical protein
MRNWIGIFLIGIIANCKNSVVTETEVFAVQKVVDFYGGVCHRYKGVDFTNTKKDAFFELEIRNSDLLDTLSNVPHLPASNIALIFYTNLKGEKRNYSIIKVKLNLSNGNTHEFEFRTEELEELEFLVKKLEVISDKIKSNNYELLISDFEENAFPIEEFEQVKQSFMNKDSIQGNIIETQFHGFSFSENKKDNKKFANLVVLMIRENGNTSVSFTINRKSKKVVALKL